MHYEPHVGVPAESQLSQSSTKGLSQIRNLASVSLQSIAHFSKEFLCSFAFTHLFSYMNTVTDPLHPRWSLKIFLAPTAISSGCLLSNVSAYELSLL